MSTEGKRHVISISVCLFVGVFTCMTLRSWEEVNVPPLPTLLHAIYFGESFSLVDYST